MIPSDPWVALRSVCGDLPDQKLETYARELHRWNRAVRLVGPRNLEGVRLQVVDALLPFLHHPPSFPLLDIGSGAGLPGIPLALAFPRGFVTCLEAKAKRVSFLRHAARTLDLRNLDVVHARTDEDPAAKPELRSSFASATARAVADVASLLGAARPFLRPWGLVYLPRGKEAAPRVPGWDLVLDASYPPPPGLGPRRLLAYRSQSASLNGPRAPEDNATPGPC